MCLPSNLPYDETNPSSILQYAKKLEGSTLRKSITSHPNNTINANNKGRFGQLLETVYFFKKNNSKSEADFCEAGLELKATPLKQKRNKQFVSKERLVLGIIDYNKINNETFKDSSFLKKNKHLLIIFYLHDSEKDILDYEIKLVGEWKILEEDFKQIEEDWHKIQSFVRDGKAEELSGKDTMYLEACTKGKSSESMKPQPNSTVMAKQRALAFKNKYVNHIIDTFSNKNDQYGKIISRIKSTTKKTVEERTKENFKFFIGKSIGEICNELSIDIPSHPPKNFYANISKSILNVHWDKKIEEFEKADICLKTIRINKNNLPYEDISFPYFEYENLIGESTWEESSLYKYLDRKFCFVFIKNYLDGKPVLENLILEKVIFWNIPTEDLLNMKSIWMGCRDLVKKGMIVESITAGKRSTHFKYLKNSVGHIRPHAQNKNDTSKLPYKDIKTGFESYTKHSFWLNKKYIKDNIYLFY